MIIQKKQDNVKNTPQFAFNENNNYFTSENKTRGKQEIN